ncbi:septal ring lytic transglycosylase RlpA family protein [Nitratireductor kimnyeongensis]|uniref:Endolytic peptidoglycan transglycosylase RlpA n=1 Tax=Nitratireductor kimnyeongensis TaxID=430679 RepID=A0ABW0TAB8_9HYPH|nr:septal ring lytic transglycosylase RlpA family protein [Nitratireductor kimnyeongensis]QZZ35508.1 septal ring lytic transglycosylase RlpA family protein [Nitratireductor kimnyeongensis]
MSFPTAARRLSGRRLSCGIAIAACAALLTACNSTTPKVAVSKSKSKEYFAESEYGVKASPRISTKSSNLRRGGGRYQVGKPYQIKGRWYHPKEDPDYEKVGAASWYGDAFHGRLTANGEIYDMTHLTAAHPTMPLPSYARVTNMNNGSSVLVRVNDRGPFAHNRIIDLSKRAAQLLDYQSAGVAQVKVEYVGPAPLEGRDDEYLLASYRPSGVAPDPSDGQATGVMVAMNGPTPTAMLPGVKAADAFASQPGLTPPTPIAASSAFELPSSGPIVPDRPRTAPLDAVPQNMAALSYADQRINAAAGAFDSVLSANNALRSQDVSRWWQQKNDTFRPDTPRDTGTFVSVGVWTERSQAEVRARELATYGEPQIETVYDESGAVHYALKVTPSTQSLVDTLLQAAWASGADDAFIVR